MCTVLLPPGVNPTAVNKYIISVIKSIIIIINIEIEHVMNCNKRIAATLYTLEKLFVGGTKL